MSAEQSKGWKWTDHGKLTHEWWKFWFCSDCWVARSVRYEMQTTDALFYGRSRLVTAFKKERARKCWKVSITVVSSRCSSFKLSSCKVCSHLFMVKLYMFTNRAHETVNGQYRSIYCVHPFGANGCWCCSRTKSTTNFKAQRLWDELMDATCKVVAIKQTLDWCRAFCVIKLLYLSYSAPW